VKVLRLWTLEERRNRADLIEVYKIMHGLTDMAVSAFFQINTDSSTRGHSVTGMLRYEARVSAIDNATHVRPFHWFIRRPWSD